MTHVVNLETSFKCVSRATFAAHIRIYNLGLKCDGQAYHWFERVSLHHQCSEFYSTGYYRFNRDNIWRWQEMGAWAIALYQDFLKIITKATLGPHSHGNMNRSEIFWVTEPTLNVGSVTPHQLKNGRAPIMAWWLPGASFSVDTVLSAQHHQVCNKTNTKLSTLGSVST